MSSVYSFISFISVFFFLTKLRKGGYKWLFCRESCSLARLTATHMTYDAEKHDSHIYLLVPLYFLAHSWRRTWAENVQIYRGKQNLRDGIVEFNHHLTFPWKVLKAQKAKCVVLQLENIHIFLNRVLYHATSCCWCFPIS